MEQNIMVKMNAERSDEDVKAKAGKVCTCPFHAIIAKQGNSWVPGSGLI
jgi:hypothetical protein